MVYPLLKVLKEEFHIKEAKDLSEKIGYPVLIKAAGGGGGKGRKVVNKSEEFENLFLTAKSEAKNILEMMKFA